MPAGTAEGDRAMNYVSKRNRGASLIFAVSLAVACAAAALIACGGEDNCAVQSENCAAQYIQQHGLSGCCSGLTCQDSAVTPGARVCR